MTSALIAALTAAAVALLSAFMTYIITKRSTRHSDQITFIGKQLGEFYGPLLALSQASLTAWAEFKRTYGDDRSSLFPSRLSTTGHELESWKYWLKYVFMPINRKMLDIVLSKMDLIEGDIPQCILDFCRHVTSLEVTLAQWEDSNYSSLSVVAQHPGAPFDNYIEKKYNELKARQGALLRN